MVTEETEDPYADQTYVYNMGLYQYEGRGFGRVRQL